ncbi:MAG: IS1182 family transposase [Acidobacteria bacterium]|nr:IS1182 family transposase [Acidobacteriota bacterium]
MRCSSLDQLLPPEHQARMVWSYVEQLDLAPLLQGVQAVAGQPGRDANDPRLLLALWLYATLDGVGSARELDRLCREHLAYQWLCGGVSMNYHTLADFRTQHSEFLRQLLIESVAAMQHQGLVDLKRVAQDGMKVRASAGAKSFRRKPSLEKCLEEAQQQVAALEKQLHEDAGAVSRRQEAARKRAATERVARLEKAQQEHQKLITLREQQKRDKGVKFDPAEVRSSTTDPEARKMKMADGGTRPGYNVQFASTTDSGVIVGVGVTNSGGDGGQMAPMVENIQKSYGQAPAEILVDGGFTTLEDIEKVHHDHDTKVYGPIKEEEKKKANGVDPYQPRLKDKPGVAAWRTRMGTEEAKDIYRLRAQTAEWVNAEARNRGLYQVRVRGLQKVLAVALWYALAHNLLRRYTLQTRKQACPER